MTSLAVPYRENIGKNEPISKRTRSYYQQRFQQQVFARIAKAFAERADEFKLTKSAVATLIDKDKGQVNRLLSHPTNLTLDTLSEIALALNYEPTVFLDDLDVPPRHNFCHPAYDEYVAKPVAPKEAQASSATTSTVSTVRILERSSEHA